MRLVNAVGDSLGLLVVAVCMAGCLHVPATADLRPFVAVSMGYASVAAQPGPAPAPAPAVCRTCGGTGKLGDGRVFVPCPDCQKKSTKETPPCPTGTCPTPTAR